MARSFRYQEIADSLRAAISDGLYREDGILPSEAELSAVHGASRVTIRRALEALREEGLVDSRQGFGWFVGADPLRQSLDSLETIEQQLADAGRTSERRVLEFRFRRAPEDIAALLGPEVLEVVRLNLADEVPFALVTVWCPAELGAEFSRSEVEESTFVDLLGDRLGPARQVISATLADQDTAAVLGIEPGAAVLRVRRVTTDRSGGNALVSEHLYPAGQTEFEVTLQNPSSHTAGLRLVE
jgi:GntR family transcriptional regulator